MSGVSGHGVGVVAEHSAAPFSMRRIGNTDHGNNDADIYEVTSAKGRVLVPVARKCDAMLFRAAPDLLDALLSLRERLLACDPNISVHEAYDSFYQGLVDDALGNFLQARPVHQHEAPADPSCGGAGEGRASASRGGPQL